MTNLSSFRAAVEKRLAYNRTVRALSDLPVNLAVEDLGIFPGDAKAIARQAVYG